MFKPYRPKHSLGGFRHELHEPLKNHLAEMVGAHPDEHHMHPNAVAHRTVTKKLRRIL